MIIHVARRGTAQGARTQALAASHLRAKGSGPKQPQALTTPPRSRTLIGPSLLRSPCACCGSSGTSAPGPARSRCHPPRQSKDRPSCAGQRKGSTQHVCPVPGLPHAPQRPLTRAEHAQPGGCARHTATQTAGRRRRRARRQHMARCTPPPSPKRAHAHAYAMRPGPTHQVGNNHHVLQLHGQLVQDRGLRSTCMQQQLGVCAGGMATGAHAPAVCTA